MFLLNNTCLLQEVFKFYILVNLIYFAYFYQAPLCNSVGPTSHAAGSISQPPPHPPNSTSIDSCALQMHEVRENGNTVNILTGLDSTMFDHKTRQLPARIKFYEFYNAPITKFWAHSVSLMFFL